MIKRTYDYEQRITDESASLVDLALELLVKEVDEYDEFLYGLVIFDLIDELANIPEARIGDGVIAYLLEERRLNALLAISNQDKLNHPQQWRALNLLVRAEGIESNIDVARALARSKFSSHKARILPILLETNEMKGVNNV